MWWWCRSDGCCVFVACALMIAFLMIESSDAGIRSIGSFTFSVLRTDILFLFFRCVVKYCKEIYILTPSPKSTCRHSHVESSCPSTTIKEEENIPSFLSKPCLVPVYFYRNACDKGMGDNLCTVYRYFLLLSPAFFFVALILRNWAACNLFILFFRLR